MRGISRIQASPNTHDSIPEINNFTNVTERLLCSGVRRLDRRQFNNPYTGSRYYARSIVYPNNGFRMGYVSIRNSVQEFEITTPRKSFEGPDGRRERSWGRPRVVWLGCSLRIRRAGARNCVRRHPEHPAFHEYTSRRVWRINTFVTVCNPVA